MSEETPSTTATEASGDTLSAVIDKKNEEIPHEVVETESLENSRVRLVVRVPGDAINEKVEEVLKDFKRQASLPGFRPGKAPIQLVRKRYAKNAKDEAVRRMVTRLAELGAESKNLEALAQPGYDGWKDADNGDVDVTVLLEVRPEIAVNDEALKDLEVEVTKGDVADSDIDHELDHLRGANAAFEEKEGAVFERQDGAALKVEATTPEGEKLHELSKTIEFTPQLENQVPAAVYDALVGAKAGDTVEVKDVDLSQVVGQDVTANFNATVVELRKRILPELDDEFAKDVSADFETLDDLKAHIKKELESRRDERRRNETIAGIYKVLRERVQFDVPPTLVGQLANRSLQRAEQQLRQYGTTLRKMGAEFVNNYVQKAQADAAVEARNLLLADQVGRHLEVEPTDEDMQKEFERIAEIQGRKPLAVRAALEAQNRLDEFKADLRLKLVNDKLVAMAKVTETEESKEEETGE